MTRVAVNMAVCMANGGGGTVVFGVRDKVTSREHAIAGVPLDLDVNQLKRAIYDGTDPKITPVFETLAVPEGTRRLILMHVCQGMPPYTNTRGRGTVRIGKDCNRLTGTLRSRILEETGELDYTANAIDAPLSKVVSPVAMEALRQAAIRERAPNELMRLRDEDLLQTIGVTRDGRATRAAVLLAGSPDSIAKYAPNFGWTHVRMASSTGYSDRADGRDSIALTVARILDRIMADNSIETVHHGPYHFEYRTYPEEALREALLNALCHGDFRVASPRLVKQYSDRIEITNPGGFINGITPENILHHVLATRNPCLVEALTRLRLINRTNLGMERIYSALLIEGKPPPSIEEVGNSVRLTFRASKMAPLFRGFVADESNRGVYLAADHLLILHHLIRNAQINAREAASLCQRTETDAQRILAEMEGQFGYVEVGGSGSQQLWTLRDDVRTRVTLIPHEEVSWATLKARVVQVIRQNAARGGEALSNADVRQITGFDPHRTRRLIRQLQDESLVEIVGHGRAARYLYTGPVDPEADT